ALDVRFLGEIEIATVGLAFAGKCRLQVLKRLRPLQRRHGNLSLFDGPVRSASPQAKQGTKRGGTASPAPYIARGTKLSTVWNGSKLELNERKDLILVLRFADANDHVHPPHLGTVRRFRQPGKLHPFPRDVLQPPAFLKEEMVVVADVRVEIGAPRLHDDLPQ